MRKPLLLVLVFLLVAVGTGSRPRRRYGEAQTVPSATRTPRAAGGGQHPLRRSLSGRRFQGCQWLLLRHRHPSGIYRVQVSLIGYQTTGVYSEVRIMADATTDLNAELRASAVEMVTVEVTAQRPVVQKDLTSTRTFVDGETIVKDLRFQDVGEILRLQAGVTQGLDGSLHVRGGRSGGTVYQIDGIPVQNPFVRSTAGEIEVETVNELQAQLGTFDAEYGNAADGVITVFTKDGGDKYTGRFGYESPRLNSSPYQKADWNLDRAEVQSLTPDQQKLYLDEVRRPDGTSAYEYVSVLDDTLRGSHPSMPWVPSLGSLSGPCRFSLLSRSMPPVESGRRTARCRMAIHCTDRCH